MNNISTMKKMFLVIVSCAMMVGGSICAKNTCDTLQCINDILQILDNATLVSTSYADWNGDWSIDEWQQIKYMPSENGYSYFHKQENASVTFQENEGFISIEGYKIHLSDATQSVMDVKPQWVNNIYGSQDYVTGKLVIVNKQLYLHLHIVGTQDFAVDIYGVSDEPMFTPDTKWNHVIRLVDGGPIAKRIYGMRDTVVNGVSYQWVRWRLLRSEGAKVWCLVDSMGEQVEQLLYDFDLKVGDSISHIRLQYYDEDYPVLYSKVTHVESITLQDGRSARKLSYDKYRSDDIEHVGNVWGLLEVATSEIAINGTIEDFICCTHDGVVLYETGPNECDKLMNMVFTEEHSPAQVSFDGKLLRDGQLFIQNGNKTYNALGVPVK